MAQNPYTNFQAATLANGVNQNLAQNIMPGIRSGAQSAGQYGGSRQGIAEGVAAGNASSGLASSVANLYSTNYQNDQTNDLNRQSISNNYMLGQGQLNNSATAQNQNFYSQQRGQDLSQAQLGSQLYGAGVNGNLGLGSSMYNTGQTAQNAPLSSLQQYSNTISPYSGLNSSQTKVANGSRAAGALGGAIQANTLANAWNTPGAGSAGYSNANLGLSGYGGYQADPYNKPQM